MLENMASGSGRVAGPRGAKAGAPKKRSVSSTTSKTRSGSASRSATGSRSTSSRSTTNSRSTTSSAVSDRVTQWDWSAQRGEFGYRAQLGRPERLRGKAKRGAFRAECYPRVFRSK